MPSLPVLLLLLIPLVHAGWIQSTFGIGREQSVAVEGNLTCNGKPAAGVKVKLYDVDNALDDLLAEGVTDAKGHFKLEGTETEITKIDPKLNIYHRCNYHGACLQKFSIYIPDDFITDGKKAERVFDAGSFNLNGRFSYQVIDCINRK